MQNASMRKMTINQTDGVAPGIFGAQICRTRYIDDAVETGLIEGIGQLVILGAGYDSRPYRLAGIKNVQVFELDLPAVQNDKKKKIQKYLGRLPENVSYIPIDFDKQTLEAAFSGADFDPVRPAIFIWEGVTQYINEESARKTLAFVGKSAAGSSLLFTYVLKSVIERRSNISGAEHMMEVVSRQSPWIFGLEPANVAAFLKPFHLNLSADVGNKDYQEKYLRPLGRELVVSEMERIAHATVEV